MIQMNMKTLLHILTVVTASLLLAGCGIYGSYKADESVPDQLFGANNDSLYATDESIADISWKDFFTDPLLRQLIDSALSRNTDIKSARLAIEKAQTSLTAARLAYLPSIYFSPSGSMSSFDHSAFSKTYNLPLQANMDIDLFAPTTNKRRAAKAVLLQSELREDAVRANLISTLAQHYIMLQTLDRQLEIMTKTDSLWNASLETQKSLWENGKSYSTAVNQMESSYLNIQTQIVDTRRNILHIENSICRLLTMPPHRIERSPWQEFTLPERFNTGVPGALLQKRPEIRMANYALEEAFYNTQAARAAFFPTISLQGSIGWTNNAGSVIVNPGKMLISAMASLTQPIFARGSIKANVRIQKLTREDMRNKYVQTVIDAGNQVNEALADIHSAREKQVLYHRQVEVLQDAYDGTHELMDNGKANYLEVLTAQESLLNAQLNEAANMRDAAQAVVALYIALGGSGK